MDQQYRAFDILDLLLVIEPLFDQQHIGHKFTQNLVSDIFDGCVRRYQDQVGWVS
jgi:hypothetical protein